LKKGQRRQERCWMAVGLARPDRQPTRHITLCTLLYVDNISVSVISCIDRIFCAHCKCSERRRNTSHSELCPNHNQVFFRTHERHLLRSVSVLQGYVRLLCSASSLGNFAWHVHSQQQLVSVLFIESELFRDFPRSSLSVNCRLC